MILSLPKVVGALQPQSESVHGGLVVLPKQSTPAVERLQEASVTGEDCNSIAKNKWHVFPFLRAEPLLCKPLRFCFQLDRSLSF
mmetsp:Transcript_86335/g.166199  ORF Transcript_86335/g.166199 Transcript_86335/m.166199 type:complete len:84 (-) Transcript_86335:336-587(-)